MASDREGGVEAWTEVNVTPARPVDEALLVELVGAVHDELREEIETWFFFWEPDLRLRIRWRDPDRASEQRGRLAALLDDAKRKGNIRRWYEGAHGMEGATYVGEAEHYGEDAWPWIQKDWMNGSELALALIKLDQAGRLSRPREYHWQRHVHLFTNQLLRSWETEIVLCLRQALGYIRLRGEPSDEARKLIDDLNELSRPSS